jgi:hypothetical protein
VAGKLEEHLPTSIAGVLRLRAISRPLCDRSARRFAQDDGFVGGEKHPVRCAENTKRSKKSQALGMTKDKVALPWQRFRWLKTLQGSSFCCFLKLKPEEYALAGAHQLGAERACGFGRDDKGENGAFIQIRCCG